MASGNVWFFTILWQIVYMGLTPNAMNSDNHWVIECLNFNAHVEIVSAIASVLWQLWKLSSSTINILFQNSCCSLSYSILMLALIIRTAQRSRSTLSSSARPTEINEFTLSLSQKFGAHSHTSLFLDCRLCQIVFLISFLHILSFLSLGIVLHFVKTSVRHCDTLWHVIPHIYRGGTELYMIFPTYFSRHRKVTVRLT